MRRSPLHTVQRAHIHLRSPSWSSTVLPTPSLNSHLSDPSLLPPDAKPTPDRSYITAYAPASAQHLATVPSLTKDEIRERIGMAVVAQKGWKNSSWARRRRVMRSLLAWCVTEMETIAKIASRDSGKTRSSQLPPPSAVSPLTKPPAVVDASFGEILTTCEKLRWVIANGEQILKPEQRSTPLLLAHKVSKVVFEPLGVVAAIVSWNYRSVFRFRRKKTKLNPSSLRSFHNFISPVIASLFSGNAIVVKPSENVAWSSLIFADAVRACLLACGEVRFFPFLLALPSSPSLLSIQFLSFLRSPNVPLSQDPELVQVVVTLPDSVEALTGNPRIKHITFVRSFGSLPPL